MDDLCSKGNGIPSVRVAVPLSVQETFQYAVPEGLLSKAEVGRRVMVPFRTRKVPGYIMERGEGPEGLVMREILEVSDEEPMFPPQLVPFLEWIADYYLYPVGRLVQSVLPGGLSLRVYRTGRLTDKGDQALPLLHPKSEEKAVLTWVKGNPGKRVPYPFSQIRALEKRGLLIVESRTARRKGGPLKRIFARLSEGLDVEAMLQEGSDTFKAKDEAAFLSFLAGSRGVLLKDLTGKFKNGPYLVRKWREKGLIETYEEQVFRDPSGKILFPALAPETLYDQQKQALSNIEKRLDKGGFSVCLLHGVTGSGKTEVYFRAIEHAIALGRQAVLMLPEIALAVYTEGMFRSRLGARIAVFHSGLSQGERYDQWMRMVRGEVDLVIGARSSLFAPLPKLGLIIVDEEHDGSYKQEESPRYQARDAAIVRGKMEKALVILGSGTPSVQSFHNASSGRYHLLSMPERIEKRPLPEVRVIDMKQVLEGNRKYEILSPALQQALRQTLEQGKQAILFLNRRGFHRVYLCRSCGATARCPNCDLTLIYHLKEDRLACHYCGYFAPTRTRCASCNKEGMRAFGFGTERLEEELKATYPDRSIARLDRDTISRKGESYEILRRFNDHEAEVLVGTQMVTKGYDFPDVTLVGVVAADFSLSFPDFRSGERTFQLLSQVAGRAGRGDQAGLVIIQTFNPDHYAVATARAHDYIGFYEKERGLREQLGYPPFSYIACLRMQGNSKTGTEDAARRLGEAMHHILGKWPRRGKEIQVLGPVESPLAKLRGKYRYQVLLKSKGVALLHYFLKEVEAFSRRMLKGSGVGLVIDVDPYQML